jgi:hypothetical protein
MAKSFAPEVIADSSGKWAGNACRFKTAAEAQKSASLLMMSWMAVRETRVVESEDEPNYKFVDGQGPVPMASKRKA